MDGHIVPEIPAGIVRWNFPVPPSPGADWLAEFAPDVSQPKTITYTLERYLPHPMAQPVARLVLPRGMQS